MRAHEIALLAGLIAKQQEVNIDDARSPTPRRRAPAFSLDLFGRNQKLTRSARPVHLDHLVQESWLVRNPPRRRIYDATLTQDARPLLTQAPARRAEVASPPAQVRAEPQVGDCHRMWSAKRATRAISRTSWTRTTSAPRRIAAVVVAAVPSTRSPTGRSSSLPINDLREVPMRIGWSSSRSSTRRRITIQLCSAVLPKPMPGSISTRSRRTPACTARSTDARRNRLISAIKSPL